jgi:hypothetical protein
MKDYWWERAACRNAPIDWFYNPHIPDDPNAIALCATCPVVDECWDECFSNEYSWRWGVWAGTTPQQRSEWMHDADAARARRAPPPARPAMRLRLL